MASVPPQGGRKHPHQEFIQIDTTNVLFICGGAFAGLETIIEQPHRPQGRRLPRHDPPTTSSTPASCSPGAARGPAQVRLIPEFVGRLPVVGAVQSLDRDALVQILVEPKNALVKQYRKFFEFEDVELEFTEDALDGHRRPGPARHRGPRPAGDPRRGAAQHHVRPARAQRHRPVRDRRRHRARQGQPHPRAAHGRVSRPKRAAS